MLIHMMNKRMLHPEVPKNLEHVADIATGNGYAFWQGSTSIADAPRNWIFDLKQSREGDPEANANTKYHGWDISPDLFPKLDSAKVADVDFSLHDFYKPFPEDQIGKYDLVHVRHLVLAIQGSDLKVAVQNICSLLSTLRPAP